MAVTSGAADPAALPGPVGLAQHLALNLADGAARQRLGAEFYLGRLLVRAEAHAALRPRAVSRPRSVIPYAFIVAGSGVSPCQGPRSRCAPRFRSRPWRMRGLAFPSEAR